MGRKTARVLIGPGRPYDLILVCLLVAGAILLSTYNVNGPLMWALGFITVFFAPGYALVSALFPGQKAILSQTFMIKGEERLVDISLLERLALSLGLAASVMALAGTLLTRGALNLNALTVGLEAAALTYVLSALAIYRRSRLPMGDQYALFLKPRNGKRPITASEKAISVVIVAALVVLVGVTATGMNAHPYADPFSEFSITGADGNMEHLPSTLAANQQGYVTVTVSNHLGASGHFILILSLTQNSSSTTAFDPSQTVTVGINGARSMTIDLADGESWEATLSFLIPAPGERTLFLRLDDGLEVKDLWMPLTIT
jgi:uncharacterized membrane protein